MNCMWRTYSFNLKGTTLILEISLSNSVEIWPITRLQASHFLIVDLWWLSGDPALVLGVMKWSIGGQFQDWPRTSIDLELRLVVSIFACFSHTWWGTNKCPSILSPVAIQAYKMRDVVKVKRVDRGLRYKSVDYRKYSLSLQSIYQSHLSYTHKTQLWLCH